METLNSKDGTWFYDVSSVQKCDIIIQHSTASEYIPRLGKDKRIKAIEMNPEMATLDITIPRMITFGDNVYFKIWYGHLWTYVRFDVHAGFLWHKQYVVRDWLPIRQPVWWEIHQANHRSHRSDGDRWKREKEIFETNARNLLRLRIWWACGIKGNLIYASAIFT